MTQPNPHNNAEKTSRTAVIPFMYRNHYLDGCGWWVKRDAPEDAGSHVAIANTQLGKSEKALLASLIGKRLLAIECASMQACIPEKVKENYLAFLERMGAKMHSGIAEFARDTDEALAIGFILDDGFVLLTHEEEHVEDFGGNPEDVAAFRVRPVESPDAARRFFGEDLEPHETIQIGRSIEDVLVVEELEQHGVGTATDSYYSYTKAVCLALDDGRKLLFYRDSWYREYFGLVLGPDAMGHLPAVGDEVDWEMDDGYSVRRATVSLATCPKPEVIDYDGRCGSVTE